MQLIVLQSLADALICFCREVGYSAYILRSILLFGLGNGSPSATNIVLVVVLVDIRFFIP